MTFHKGFIKLINVITQNNLSFDGNITKLTPLVWNKSKDEEEVMIISCIR